MARGTGNCNDQAATARGGSGLLAGMAQAPAAPGFNETQPLVSSCPSCGPATGGDNLLLYFRDHVVGTNPVLRGDLDSTIRVELVSFEPTGELTIEDFDQSDDWQVECDDCGDTLYENFA
jgi:hypothetical protein